VKKHTLIAVSEEDILGGHFESTRLRFHAASGKLKKASADCRRLPEEIIQNFLENRATKIPRLKHPLTPILCS